MQAANSTPDFTSLLQNLKNITIVSGIRTFAANTYLQHIRNALPSILSVLGEDLKPEECLGLRRLSANDVAVMAKQAPVNLIDFSSDGFVRGNVQNYCKRANVNYIDYMSVVAALNLSAVSWMAKTGQFLASS